MNALALTFQEIQFDVVDRNGQPWLQAAQIAKALGYSNDNAVSRIYARNSDEFTDNMTGKVKLTLSGNLETEVRIFSLRGCHLLAMFARTKVAKEFRKWVLDVLDSLTPAPAPKCALKEIAPSKTKKALPGCLTVEHQDAIKALVKTRAEIIEDPKKRAAATIGMWSALGSKFGVKGMKDGYKNIPADQFTEALSVVARFPLQGELILAGEQVPAKPKVYHYPREMLEQAHFVRPEHGITAGLHLSMLASPQFVSTIGRLLDEMGLDGHELGAPRAEFAAIREALERMDNLAGLIMDGLLEIRRKPSAAALGYRPK
jgi:prophage antirepressor-like protein